MPHTDDVDEEELEGEKDHDPQQEESGVSRAARNQDKRRQQGQALQCSDYDHASIDGNPEPRRSKLASNQTARTLSANSQNKLK